MKAIVDDKYGPLDALGLRDIDKPVAQGQEVLVRVHAASLHVGGGTSTEKSSSPYEVNLDRRNVPTV